MGCGASSKKYKEEGDKAGSPGAPPKVVVTAAEEAKTEVKAAVAGSGKAVDGNWAVELFGSELLTKDGVKPTAEVVAGKRAVLIYFSAHWCPPCRGFTPVLADAYKKYAVGDVAVVFASSDRDEGSFGEYYGEMPWAALPFADRARKETLGEKFEVQGIPMLIVLDASGATVTTSGRGAVQTTTDLGKSLVEWKVGADTIQAAAIAGAPVEAPATEAAAAAPAAETEKAAEEEEEEEEDDAEDELPEPPPAYLNKGARSSVSAEAYGAWNKKEDFTPPVHEKTEDQKARLTTILGKSFLFAALAKKDVDIIIQAMEEKKLEPGTRIIHQDGDGDCLFVVESGTLECFKRFEKDGEEKMVKTIAEGDAFGELALLYNCPRAASVQSKDDCVLWQLDRGSFNHIVKDAAAKKREKYEGFLAKVTLLESMDTYGRNQLADALKSESFAAGTAIITQGEPGDKFYIVEEGQLVAQKDGVEVLQLKEGDYFGELALLRDEPRAASVTATSDVVVVSVERNTFNKMLGPLKDMMEKHTSVYETPAADAGAAAAG